jgi:hypothetical protein
MLKALVSALSRRWSSSSNAVAPGAVEEVPSGYERVSLPERSLTKMEEQLHAGKCADVHVINPTLTDIVSLCRLPQGSLTAVWLDVRFMHDHSVSAFFVAHEAHDKGPYILLRAANRSAYHLSLLQRSISERFEISAIEDIALGSDESSVTIHFEREKGGDRVYSDKRTFQRAMRLITDPAVFGAEAACPTRVVLRDLPVAWFAPLNRLGDAPYKEDKFEPRSLITIDRTVASANP